MGWMLDQSSGDPQYLEAWGSLVECRAFGPSPDEAATIVLLHDGVGCLSLWRDFPQLLSKRTGCGVFVYSRAGYGRSEPALMPRPLDYLAREATGALPELLAQIAPQRLFLMGQGEGASIAALYAGELGQDALAGLVLMAPYFFPEPKTLDMIHEMRKAYEAGPLKARMAQHHHMPDVAFLGWADTWLHPEFADWNIGAAIDNWRVPCLAFQGIRDQFATPAQLDEIETRCFTPYQTMLLPECGHAPHLDQRDVVLEQTARFLAPLMPG